ncbi:DNA polymerase IV [Natronomonas sp. LN261]|jgi:DNA polymerase IV (DinB-like DNA polymerase)|uniref:DNA polymerase Y family protein n=1 Tax=Natronomonas sp. LN261 TaxID=2750669 RepID=UPI0015EF5E39|nr:DNA polymerase IV [Natronomonas sp. LN261]
MPRLPGIDPPEQVVCHVDMDCFYAACERLRDPALEGEPLVVGMGYEPGETHGAVATASYEAREHGIESAMAISEALEALPRRSDADADGDGQSGVYRPVDMPFYESVSETVRSVLSAAAETVRYVSIDEAYLDLGDVEWTAAEPIGRSIKRAIEAEAGVVASVGIAPDMTTAKLASDADKPDGLVVVNPDTVGSFLAPIPVEELHGAGPVTASALREMGFETAGEIASAREAVFVDAFGERGRDLYAQSRGEDDRVVEPKGDPKSLSSESAFTEATGAAERKKTKVRDLADEVTGRASAENALYRTIGIKVVTPPFEVNTRSRSLSGPVDDPGLVERVAIELLAEFDAEPVRKLGVRLSNLSFDDRDQATISEWAGTDADGRSPTVRGRDRDRSGGEQAELSWFE